MAYTGEIYDWDPYVGDLKRMHSGAQVDIIAYNDNGVSYEWDIQAVYRVHKDNTDIYYVGYGKGCSCDSYGYTGSSELLHFSSRRSLLYYLRNTDGFNEVYHEVRNIKARGAKPKL